MKILMLLLLSVFFSSCAFWRGVFHGAPNIDDYKIFPQATIKKSSNPFHFTELPPERKILDTAKIFRQKMVHITLEEYFGQAGGNGSFLLIYNDTIVYEKYFGEFNRSSISTVFSISKSLTSLLCGIAIDKGYIKSINDPVTDYLPELNKKNAKFKSLTIEHLLDMRTGIKFKEQYNWIVTTGIARLYYGNNQLQQIKSLKFENEPGSTHYYHSIATAILGIIIERATGKGFAEYMEEKVWQPLNMEYDASISLDGKRNHFARAAVGFSTNAIDLAKIGRLYMNKGNWNGKQIVSSEWIERSVKGNVNNKGYQNCWYSIPKLLRKEDGNGIFPDSLSVVKRFDELNIPHSERCIYEPEKGEWIGETYTPNFYALGIFGQVLYVNPEKKIIAVRLGEKQHEDYYIIIHKLAEALKVKSTTDENNTN